MSSSIASNSITLPKPDQFPELTWRDARMEDAESIHQLSVAAVEVDGLEGPQPVEEIHQVFGIMGDDAPTDTLVALNDNEQVVAMAFVFVLPPGEDARQIRMGGSVHVDYRGRGIGDYLMAWMEARARQKLDGVDDGLPQKAMTNCRDHQTDRISLFEKNGFQPVRYFYKMKRDLTEPVPEKELLPELKLATWTPDLDMALLEAYNKSFIDHFGFVQFTPEIWRQIICEGPHFRGDMTYLAINADDEVVGFLITDIDASRNEGRDKKEATMGQIGVIRGWRKQGIASALMVKAMHAYRDAGFDYAVLGVDTENPTGALRLYENIGFESVRRGIAFEKTLN